jgi:hypothetical protein
MGVIMHIEDVGEDRANGNVVGDVKMRISITTGIK